MLLDVLISALTQEDEFVESKISPLIKVSCLLYQLYDGDIQKVETWIKTPNKLFFDLSPFTMVLAGKSDVVIKKIEEWLGDDHLIKEILSE